MQKKPLRRPRPHVARMRKITVINWVSRDGVMELREGSAAYDYSDEVVGRAMAERMAGGEGGGLPLGRRTYEMLHRAWTPRTGNPDTEVRNRRQKYVVSATLREPLRWVNSTRLAGDPAESVARLKGEPGGDLAILASGQRIHARSRHGLIDGHLLLIYPAVRGTGLRLFPGDSAGRPRLRDSATTPRGVVIATFETAR